MASKTVRKARYWLKDNSMDYYFPRLTQEKWEERKSLWQTGNVGAAIFGGIFGTYHVLNYFFPKHIHVSIPAETIFGFDYVPRAVHRVVQVRDESDE